MPLVRFLGNHSFGPEAIAVMTAAFEDTLRTLGLVDHSGLATESARPHVHTLMAQQLILKRASASRPSGDGAMTITTCSPPAPSSAAS
jgi:hypothetical protein